MKIRKPFSNRPIKLLKLLILKFGWIYYVQRSWWSHIKIEFILSVHWLKFTFIIVWNRKVRTCSYVQWAKALVLLITLIVEKNLESATQNLALSCQVWDQGMVGKTYTHHVYTLDIHITKKRLLKHLKKDQKCFSDYKKNCCKFFILILGEQIPSTASLIAALDKILTMFPLELQRHMFKTSKAWIYHVDETPPDI